MQSVTKPAASDKKGKMPRKLVRQSKVESIAWQRRLAAVLSREISARSLIFLTGILIFSLLGGLGYLPDKRQRQIYMEQTTQYFIEKINKIALDNGLKFQTVKIEIENQNRLEHDKIRKLLGIRADQSIIMYDREAAREKLESLGWVAKADLHVFYPKYLQVLVEEEVVFGIWQINRELWFINAKGKKLSPALKTELASYLPFFVGDGANIKAGQLRNWLQNFPYLLEKTVSASRINERRWNLHLVTGHVILLPEKNIMATLTWLNRQVETENLLLISKKRIDLRISDRVTFSSIKS